MNKKIKSIPTTYKGILFRSKLEASWARFFDSIGMNWISEIEGYEFSDGLRYLPDFWLPDCKTFFEVKGPLNEKDMLKMRKLAEGLVDRGVMVAIGGGSIPDSLGLVYPIPFEWSDEWGSEDGQGIICGRDHVDIAICNKCKRPYIIWKNQGWRCRNCGYWEGDETCERFILYGKEEYKRFNYTL